MSLNGQDLNSCTYSFLSDSILYVIWVFLRKAVLSHITGVGNRILQLSFHCIYLQHFWALGERQPSVCWTCNCVTKPWCCIDPKKQIPTLLQGLLCLLRKERQVLQAGCELGLSNAGCQASPVSRQVTSGTMQIPLRSPV